MIQTTETTLPENITTAMDSMELLLFNVVNSDISVLRDASRHILQAGGKRIRPRLLLLSYAASGGIDMAKVIPVAASVELIHTASVVHDDINDDGTLRRGRPSVNARWGRVFALLTGDFLFTKVCKLMIPYEELNLLFAEVTATLVEGEALQAIAAKEADLSYEVYYDIISRKTASLFKASALMGAKLSDANEEILIALGQYGYKVGLAFQLVDDILDITGDESRLGKTTGVDMEQGKGFASAHGGNGRNNSDTMEVIKRAVMAGNTIDAAKTTALELVQMAIAALDVLPDSIYKEALVDLAQAVVDRRS